ncbi:MAG: hypothetical protein AAFY36_17200, partial [Bacteroidota bacterium]
VKTNVEKAEFYNILVVQYTVNEKYLDSIQIGREALQLLDINFTVWQLLKLIQSIPKFSQGLHI